MVTVFRLAKARHARTAFSGIGARLAGGRWNARGQAVVYTSSSLALAALESFVHLQEEFAALAFVAFSVEIPDDVRITTCRRPPRDWRMQPAPESTVRYGSAWLEAGDTAVLAVPSVVVPSELNYVLNPAHADFRRLKISKPSPFVFDPRLWK